MSNKPKKKKFEVQQNETIVDCLKRMELEGYRPIRRVEEPIFIEVKEGNKISQRIHSQKIIFEGVQK
ncbi:NETI motif-containing protein [Calidifontibacillus oryziterrae]|uniref:NETI motif-containing protein n=1 Tax=Calidifontibacillus oryziterrae TaxID=1191699 RepID=UPI0002F9F091|nr:NETI motif-containing protein [Calidifontibacillus oryziterrae]